MDKLRTTYGKNGMPELPAIDDSDWEAHISTKPDGMTQEDLRRALAERQAGVRPIIANEMPPSLDETTKLERVP